MASSEARQANDGDDALAREHEERLEALEQELGAQRDEQLRLRAEMENLRKRAAREVEAARKFGAERLLGDLAQVADALEAALGSEGGDAARLREGIDMTLRKLQQTLERHGLSGIDPVPGEAFDPELHQAVSTLASAVHAPGSVVQVLQKGYRLNERLLRPALVVVAADAPSSGDA